MKRPEGEGCKKSAGDRLRDVVITQKGDVSRDDHAGEIHDDTEGKRQEIRRYKRIGGWCHDDLAAVDRIFVEAAQKFILLSGPLIVGAAGYR
jgi:hypothetical protein